MKEQTTLINTNINFDKLKQRLILAEGIRLKVYADTMGIMTIGVGRNLETTGISKVEAMMMLENDIQSIFKETEKIPLFYSLNEVRQRVILEMIFNIGVRGLMNFKNMWAAIAQRQWEKAADEMLHSKWAKQVGQRAIHLSTWMRTGVDT